ncbi:MAG: hypothetical protein FWD73_08635 [Polyangiaceae bacterium]|nr:hypothetical protein [Polyangiaceae bacterium]
MSISFLSSNQIEKRTNGVITMTLNHPIRILAVLTFSTITVIACGGGSGDSSSGGSLLDSCTGNYTCTASDGSSVSTQLQKDSASGSCMAGSIILHPDHTVSSTTGSTYSATWSGNSDSFEIDLSGGGKMTCHNNNPSGAGASTGSAAPAGSSSSGGHSGASTGSAAPTGSSSSSGYCHNDNEVPGHFACTDYNSSLTICPTDKGCYRDNMAAGIGYCGDICLLKECQSQSTCGTQTSCKGCTWHSQ